MASAEERISATIGDYLLGLADGVVAAQRELDREPGTTHRYHLPRLEFELKVMMEIDEEPAAPILGGLRGPTLGLRVRPVLAQEAGQAELASIVSTIHGELVAAPIDRRAITLRSEVTAKGPSAREIALVAAEEGAPVEGIEVHFNVDPDQSLAINQALGIVHAPSADTGFDRGVVVTDASGRASATLEIAAGEPAGSIVSVVLDAAGKSEQLHLRVEGEM